MSKTKRTAYETATREYDDAIKCAEALLFNLKEAARRPAKDPKNWGHAGDAAHYRARIEELLIGLYGIDEPTEEQNHAEARRRVGIAVDRDWE